MSKKLQKPWESSEYATKVNVSTRYDRNPNPVVENGSPFILTRHLYRRLTWRKHITTKRKQLDRKLRNLYWIIGRKSQLSLENKLLVYKVILKPVWTYGIQTWRTASNSNLEILERFQSKVLRIITDAPWYVPNAIIKSDLQVPTVRQEARQYSANYRKRLDIHPSSLANVLFRAKLGIRRLKRLYPADLVTNGWLTQQHSPGTSILAIENRREIVTGSISYMPLTLSTQMLLNVSGQIVTNKEFIIKKNLNPNTASFTVSTGMRSDSCLVEGDHQTDTTYI